MRCREGSTREGIRTAGLIVFASLWLATARSDLEAQEDPGGRPASPSAIEVVDALFPEGLARNVPPGGAWLPLYLELRASGTSPETVTVEAKVVRRGERREERVLGVHTGRFEVPPGRAPRRVWLHVPVSPEEFSLDFVRFRLIVRGEPIPLGRLGNGGTVGISVRGESEVPCLVVGGASDEDSPWSRQIELEPNRRTGPVVTSEGVTRVRPEQLPDSILGYDAIRLVVLRGIDVSRLEESQSRALVDWVALGGCVILSPSGRDGAILESSLARELLGAEAIQAPSRHDGFRPQNIFQLDRTGATRTTSRAARTIALDPAAGRQDLELRPDESAARFDVFAPPARLIREVSSASSARVEVDLARPEARLPGESLYGEIAHGAGRVGVLAFDEQAHGFRGGFGELRRVVWRFILRDLVARKDGELASLLRRRVRPSVFTALADREREVGTWFIGTLVVIYLLLVGPGLYLVLRRRNRLASIVWVEPLVVLVYLGVIFVVGYWTKGYLTRARSLTLLHQREGSDLRIRESYLSVFSADDSEYRLASPEGEFLAALHANAEEALDRVPTSVRRRAREDDGVEEPLGLRGVRLDLWQQGVFVNVGLERARAGIRAERVEGAIPAAWRVFNELPFAVLGGRLAPSGSVFASRDLLPLPAIAPGASVLVAADATVAEDDAFQPVEERVREIQAGGPFGHASPSIVALIDRSSILDFRLDRDAQEDSIAVWLLYPEDR